MLADYGFGSFLWTMFAFFFWFMLIWMFIACFADIFRPRISPVVPRPAGSC